MDLTAFQKDVIKVLPLCTSGDVKYLKFDFPGFQETAIVEELFKLNKGGLVSWNFSFHCYGKKNWKITEEGKRLRWELGYRDEPPAEEEPVIEVVEAPSVAHTRATIAPPDEPKVETPDYQKIFNEIKAGLNIPLRAEFKDEALMKKAHDIAFEIGFAKPGMVVSHVRWVAQEIVEGRMKPVKCGHCNHFTIGKT